MKIYIGIVFFAAIVLSLILLQNFVKNLIALIDAMKHPSFFEVMKGELMKGWMVYFVAFFWALFLVLNLYV